MDVKKKPVAGKTCHLLYDLCRLHSAAYYPYSLDKIANSAAYFNMTNETMPIIFFFKSIYKNSRKLLWHCLENPSAQVHVVLIISTL